MEHKNLAKTDGLPLYLGLVSALLILFETIMSAGVSIAYTNEVYQQLGLSTTANPTTTYIEMAIGYIIYPGIFLILLLVGIGKPRRGKTFSIVWIVLSAISIIASIIALFTQKKLVELASSLVPGGYYLLTILAVLGSLCMLLSCVFLMQRLKKQENAPAPESEPNGTANP